MNPFAAAATAALPPPPPLSIHSQPFVIALCREWNGCMLVIERTAGIDQSRRYRGLSPQK